MKIKTLLAALVLAAAPGLAGAACWSGHETVMSCADGQVYDSETRSCVPVTTS